MDSPNNTFSVNDIVSFDQNETEPKRGIITRISLDHEVTIQGNDGQTYNRKMNDIELDITQTLSWYANEQANQEISDLQFNFDHSSNEPELDI